MPRGYAQDGREVMQGDLPEDFRFFLHHFFVALLGAEHDSVQAAFVDAANLFLQQADVKVFKPWNAVLKVIQALPVDHPKHGIGHRPDVFLSGALP